MSSSYPEGLPCWCWGKRIELKSKYNQPCLPKLILFTNTNISDKLKHTTRFTTFFFIQLQWRLITSDEVEAEVLRFWSYIHIRRVTVILYYLFISTCEWASQSLIYPVISRDQVKQVMKLIQLIQVKQLMQLMQVMQEMQLMPVMQVMQLMQAVKLVS